MGDGAAMAEAVTKRLSEPANDTGDAHSTVTIRSNNLVTLSEASPDPRDFVWLASVASGLALV